jgi:hypothetical protein
VAEVVVCKSDREFSKTSTENKFLDGKQEITNPPDSSSFSQNLTDSDTPTATKQPPEK